MTIFTIGFSGLYFFFSISQQVIADSEKRMYINLMADRIVETISAQAMRASTDPLNPFVNAIQYAGSLANCSSYNIGDDRRAWCEDLNANIGAFNAASGQEIRQVDVVNDGTGLIVDVSLVTSDGVISAYFTQKLRKR